MLLITVGHSEESAGNITMQNGWYLYQMWLDGDWGNLGQARRDLKQYKLSLKPPGFDKDTGKIIPDYTLFDFDPHMMEGLGLEKPKERPKTKLELTPIDANKTQAEWEELQAEHNRDVELWRCQNG